MAKNDEQIDRGQPAEDPRILQYVDMDCKLQQINVTDIRAIAMMNAEGKRMEQGIVWEIPFKIRLTDGTLIDAYDAKIVGAKDEFYPDIRNLHEKNLPFFTDYRPNK